MHRDTADRDTQRTAWRADGICDTEKMGIYTPVAFSSAWWARTGARVGRACAPRCPRRDPVPRRGPRHQRLPRRPAAERAVRQGERTHSKRIQARSYICVRESAGTVGKQTPNYEEGHEGMTQETDKQKQVERR